MPSERILVTDGEQRAALAVVRSLGRAGYRVTVAAGRVPSLAGVSRWAERQVLLPDPLAAAQEYAARVREIVRRDRIALVLPIAEPALLALTEHGDDLGALLPWPGFDAVRTVCDKPRVLAMAAGIGIPVPPQVLLTSPADPLEVGGLGTPLVLKPARSVGEAAGIRAKLGVRYTSDQAALPGALASLPDAAWPVLVQRRIEGPGVGVFLLRWNGEIQACFMHRRLREKPPSGGVSTASLAIPPDPTLLDQACRLLAALEWQGVAMVEFKRDQATGIHYLMEVNGRFWGSLALAIEAGVDFPRRLVAAALGRPEPAVSTWRAGLRLRWWWGEVDHLLARLRAAPGSLRLPAGTPGLLATAAALCLPWAPGRRGEVFRWGDPRPAWQETRDWLHRR